MEVDLFSFKPNAKFKGKTYCPSKDCARLETQLDRVRALMEDGNWRTLQEIATEINGSITGLSARLRDLRRLEGRTVFKENINRGLWKYRLVPRVQSESEGAA